MNQEPVNPEIAQEQQQPQGQRPVVPPSPSGMAIATLVLGILSLICCGFFTGIPAIIIGKQELNAIKELKSPKEGQPLATIGFILGIIGTAITCIGAILYIALLIFGISLSAMSKTHGA